MYLIKEYRINISEKCQYAYQEFSFRQKLEME